MTLITPDAPVYRCTDRREEAPGVVTFGLMPQQATAPQGPGQCVTLLWALPDGTPAPRTFTIASAPHQDGRIELTIKQAREGGATADLHARLHPGGHVALRGPWGGFGPLAYGTTGALLLIGAGSGATPAMAALRHLNADDPARDVVYLHAASTPEDVLFANELAELSASMRNLAVVLIVSRVPHGQVFLGPRGRLDRRLLTALVPDFRDRTAFVCGPDGFMAQVRAAFRSSGHDMARYHEERFHPAEAVENESAVTTSRGMAILTSSNRTIPLGDGRTLLSSLAAGGIVVPTGCRQGLCGTCRVRLVAGEVSMTDHGTLTAAERASGLVLACCSYPKGGLTIDL